MELGETGHGVGGDGAEEAVNAPGSVFTVVYGADGGGGADDVTAREDVLHGGLAVVVHGDLAPLVEGEGGEGLGEEGGVGVGTKGGDDSVALDADELVRVRVVLAIETLLLLVEFHSLDLLGGLIEDDLLGEAVRHEVNLLVHHVIDFLGHGAEVRGVLAEDEGDVIRAATERGLRTVGCDITTTKHDDLAGELGELGHAGAGGKDGLGRKAGEREELLGGPEALLASETLELLEGNSLSAANSNEDGLVASSLERGVVVLVGGLGFRDERVSEVDLDAERLHELHLELDCIVLQTELGNLSRGNTTTELLTLKDLDVLVTKTGEVGGAADGGRAEAEEGDLVVEAARGSNLGGEGGSETHLTELLNGELLETRDVNGTVGGVGEVAAASTEVGSGANHATGETARVVRHDDLGGTVPVAVRNAGDETLDINRGGAALLTRSISTLEAASGLTDGVSLLHSGGLDVGKVVQELVGLDILLNVALPVTLLLEL